MIGKVKNPICFWCLDAYLNHYQKVFENSGVKVCSIESSLHQEYKESLTTEYANFVKEMIKETLKEDRNTVRDRVSIKNAVALFILLSQGGYVLDTNVEKDDSAECDFWPHFPVFFLPKIFEDGRYVYDFWMLYSPPNNPSTIQAIIKSVMSRWPQVQDCYEKEGYTEKFHGLSSSAFAGSIFYTPAERNFWETVLIHHGAKAIIKQLGVTKRYFNTHKPITLCEYNENSVLLRIQFSNNLANTSLSLFNTSTKNIIFDYLYDGSVTEEPIKSLLPKNVKGNFPNEIFITIYYDDIKQLEEYLKLGIDINKTVNLPTESVGETPAHFAVRCNKPEALRLLLNKGAKSDIKCRYYMWRDDPEGFNVFDLIRWLHPHNPHFQSILRDFKASDEQRVVENTTTFGR